MKKIFDDIVEFVPLFLSILVAVFSWLYDIKKQREAKDPLLALYRDSSTEIRFSIENEKVQADWFELVFPSHGVDTVTVYASEIEKRPMGFHTVVFGPYSRTLNTKWFKYFDLLASDNDIVENQVFTLPFCVDIYYHYYNKKMRVVYLVNLDLCLIDRTIHIKDWNYEKIKINRIKDPIVNYGTLLSDEFSMIDSWRYSKRSEQ